MTKVEDLSDSLELMRKHGRGGAIFVLNRNGRETSQTIRAALAGHPHSIQHLIFDDEKSLGANHGVLKDTQFQVEKHNIQIIEIPEKLFVRAMRGDLGLNIQKDITDAHIRRIGVIDED